MHEVSLTYRSGGHQAMCTCGWSATVRADRALARQEALDHARLYADLSAEDLEQLLQNDTN